MINDVDREWNGWRERKRSKGQSKERCGLVVLQWVFGSKVCPGDCDRQDWGIEPSIVLQIVKMATCSFAEASETEPVSGFFHPPCGGVCAPSPSIASKSWTLCPRFSLGRILREELRGTRGAVLGRCTCLALSSQCGSCSTSRMEESGRSTISRGAVRRNLRVGCR